MCQKCLVKYGKLKSCCDDKPKCCDPCQKPASNKDKLVTVDCRFDRDIEHHVPCIIFPEAGKDEELVEQYELDEQTTSATKVPFTFNGEMPCEYLASFVYSAKVESFTKNGAAVTDHDVKVLDILREDVSVLHKGPIKQDELNEKICNGCPVNHTYDKCNPPTWYVVLSTANCADSGVTDLKFKLNSAVCEAL